jgi:hypothetical protein
MTLAKSTRYNIRIFINFLELPYERYNLTKESSRAIMKKADDAFRISTVEYPVCMQLSHEDKLKRNIAKIAKKYIKALGRCIYYSRGI